jgi:hypothetical protein
LVFEAKIYRAVTMMAVTLAADEAAQQWWEAW